MKAMNDAQQTATANIWHLERLLKRQDIDPEQKLYALTGYLIDREKTILADLSK